MEEAIRTFHTQFAFNPIVENADKLARADSFIVCGMGGSHLAADLLKSRDPRLDLLVHSDYGLPRVPEYFLRQSLIIISSYSGNTEEALDTLQEGIKHGLNLAVVASGGEALALAKRHGIPYIALPSDGIQPRSALGFSLKGLLKLMGYEELSAEASSLATVLNPRAFELPGKEIARELAGFVPLIYASTPNRGIAYNWKIKLNETGKIPAFCNVLPELNHNEMTGFDTPLSARVKGAQQAAPREMRQTLNKPFTFLFLADPADDPRITKRMEILRGLYEERGFPVKMLPLTGATVFEKIFSSLVLADWTAFYTARHYGLEEEQVPMVEEFKRLMKK